MVIKKIVITLVTKKKNLYIKVRERETASICITTIHWKFLNMYTQNQIRYQNDYKKYVSLSTRPNWATSLFCRRGYECGRWSNKGNVFQLKFTYISFCGSFFQLF